MITPLETLLGFGRRIGVKDHVMRNWWTRSKNGGPVPKALPKAKCIDSSGREIWEAKVIDKWWAEHPSNPKAAS